MGLLDDALAGVADGGKVVLVRGEAGIGKSALVNEFVASAAHRAHVLVGSCDDFLTPQPLAPIWEMGREEPRLYEVVRTGEARAVMEEVFDLLARQLRPTVVVVEDVQWADAATLDLIAYLGRRISHTNGLVVLTFRDDSVSLEHPLRAVIGDIPPRATVRIPLQPLSRDAVVSMLEGIDLDTDEVLALTGGNPLFVREVIESGRTLPASVRDAVIGRAAHLSGGAMAALGLISVAPAGIAGATLERLADRSDLDELRSTGLIVDEGTHVVFHHEIARRVVEEALGVDERRRANDTLLRALDTDVDPAILAHHAREAGDVDAVMRFTPGAARAAMNLGSYREALDHLLGLSSLLDRFPRAERAELLGLQARAEFLLGSPDGGIGTMDRAIAELRSLDEKGGLARALIDSAAPLIHHGGLEEADVRLAEAIAMLEADGLSSELARALSEAARLSLLRGDPPPVTLDAVDRALVVAEAAGDLRSAIGARISGAFLTRGPESLEIMEECRDLAEQAGFAWEETRASVNLAMNAAWSRGALQAIDLGRRAAATARRHGFLFSVESAELATAEALLMSGDWRSAEQTLIDLSVSGMSTARIDTILGLIAARTGREAAAYLDRAWESAIGGGQPQYIGLVGDAIAEHAWLTDTHDEATLERLDVALAALELPEYPFSRGSLTCWLWRLGQLDRQVGGLAEPYRAVLAGDANAAATFWDARQCPYDAALALTAGDDDERLRALRIFESLELDQAADRLRADLRRDGVTVPRRPARSTRQHPAGLTARQDEVLRLLDEGLSSPEIADALFLSVRTVESHVAAIFMKLNVSNRGDAVSAARDSGIL